LCCEIRYFFSLEELEAGLESDAFDSEGFDSDDFDSEDDSEDFDSLLELLLLSPDSDFEDDEFPTPDLRA
jgi:hypothetical protein